MSNLTNENISEIVNLLSKMLGGDATTCFTKLQEYEGMSGFCSILNV